MWGGSATTGCVAQKVETVRKQLSTSGYTFHPLTWDIADLFPSLMEDNGK